MMMNLEALRQRIKGQATPEQLLWVSRVLFFTGCAMLWRAFQTVQPGTILAMVGLGVFAASAVCYVNLVIRTPRLQGAMRWSVLLLAGGVLNYAVIIANGGYMPAVSQYSVAGMYCPIDGANLVWLADWIFGFVSPGDVLIIAGALGMAAALTWQRRERRA